MRSTESGTGYRGGVGLAHGVMIGLLLCTTACGGGEEAGSESAPSATPPTRVLGLLTAGEVVDFESCDGEAMSIDGPVLPDLISMHAGMTPGSEPFEAVFIDVLGTVEEGPDGPHLDAVELRRVAYEGGGCDRDDRTVFFRGSGSEPVWSIVIGEDGIDWSSEEGRRNFTSNGLYDGPRGEWMFDALDAAEATVLTVSIVQTPCADPMSGAWSHLTMEVRSADARYEGCAYLSPEAES